MAKQTAYTSTPNTESFTVKRRYLTEREVEQLMDTARKIGRHGHRDATMILVAYRHGLRASEVCSLEWHQVELDQGRLHVRRAKRGTPSVHPIRGDEIRALRRLRRENPTEAHVFVSERGGPISPIGFHHLMVRLGNAAKMPFAVHPHMLRHACGFKLANDGHDTRPAALSRPQEYPAHSALYRAKSRQIQRLLARLAKPTNHERQEGNTWGSYSMVSV
jgi:integrase